MGPTYAAPVALDAAGAKLKDMAVIDMHEAFAAQVLCNVKMLGSKAFAQSELGRGEAIGEIDMDRFNVHGGSIAIGHPSAATGRAHRDDRAPRAAAARRRPRPRDRLRRRRPRRRGRAGGGVVTAAQAAVIDRSEEGILSIDVRRDGVAVVTIDDASASAENTITWRFRRSSSATIARIEEDASIAAVGPHEREDAGLRRPG